MKRIRCNMIKVSHIIRLVVLILLLSPATHAATVYHVRGDGLGDDNNSGLDWDNAFATLQKALNSLTANTNATVHTVYVQAGTYDVASRIQVTGNVHVVFDGGYQNVDTAPVQSGRTLVSDLDGTVDEHGFNFRAPVSTHDQGKFVTFRRFDFADVVNGIHLFNPVNLDRSQIALTLDDCTITANGDGVHLEYPRIEDCSIDATNVRIMAGQNGGTGSGVYINGDPATSQITNGVISSAGGRGIFVESRLGGGSFGPGFIFNLTDTEVSGCLSDGIYLDDVGVGHLNSNTVVTLTRVKITNNGGIGLYRQQDNGNSVRFFDLIATNTLIAGNGGDGVQLIGNIDLGGNNAGSPFQATLVNCTVADNAGDGLYLISDILTSASTVTARNTIFSGNGGNAIDATVQSGVTFGTMTVTDAFCDFFGNTGADILVNGGSQALDGSSLTVDPLFFGFDPDPYQLAYTSTLLDAGSDVFAPADDILGDARPGGPEPSIGAYEEPGNIPPVGNDDAYFTSEDTLLDVSDSSEGVLDNDTDVDGNPLTAQLVSPPSNGVFNFNADGTFSYDPPVDFFGVVTFTYQPFDTFELGNVTTVTITVVEVNDPPVALGESYVTDEDTPLTVAAPGVLDNDDDPVEGSPLSAVLVDDVSHGTLTLNSDGSFTYVPDQDYFGTDFFTYHAWDGADFSNTVTVDLTINSVNDIPTAQIASPSSGTIFALVLVPVTFDGSGSFDVESATLTYDWDFGDGTTGTGATPTHAYAAPGTYIVTLIVTDGHGATSPPVTVTVVAAVGGGVAIESLQYKLNYGKRVKSFNEEVDSFKLTAKLGIQEMVAAGHDLRSFVSVPLELTLAGQTWSIPQPSKSNSKTTCWEIFRVGSTRLKATLNRMTGDLKVTAKNLDLATSLEPLVPRAPATPLNGDGVDLEVPMECHVQVGDAEFTAVMLTHYTMKRENTVGIGVFGMARDDVDVPGGVFLVDSMTVTQGKGPGEQSVTLSAFFRPAPGSDVDPTGGGLEVTIGTYTETLEPDGDWAADGKGGYTYLRDGAAPDRGVAKAHLDVSGWRFTLQTLPTGGDAFGIPLVVSKNQGPFSTAVLVELKLNGITYHGLVRLGQKGNGFSTKSKLVMAP